MYIFLSPILSLSLLLPPLPSPCRPKRGALFALDLQIDEDGVHYSSDLAGFERMLVNVFDRGIQVCQKVPRLERVREEMGRGEGREWEEGGEGVGGGWGGR